MESERFRRTAIGDGIVYEKSFFRTYAGVFQDVFENSGIGFQQMEAVGKIDMIEKVGSMAAFIRETGLFRPVPMNLVRIAEQHRIVAFAEVEQKIQLIIGDIIEHGDPGGIDLLVRQRLLRQLADAVAAAACPQAGEKV